MVSFMVLTASVQKSLDTTSYIYSRRLTAASFSSVLEVCRQVCRIPFDKGVVPFSAHLANYFSLPHQLRTFYAKSVAHACQLKQMNCGTPFSVSGVPHLVLERASAHHFSVERSSNLVYSFWMAGMNS
jgi:hypothetical protein